ncbi:hypothetical protein MKOR_31370 [Mycolicibacillus koreensis]|uniref:Uncharacterized protein n=1 Tax=Mycolicibacillus koreensis TaxID=1069220 RepID=A0A7I7SIX9_9MYCO|nr:hypothetical protein B8W67_17210 [Mycolicibacillus koreensis]BBY55886.1 hypothetical protein MKOR_31370 [Mycolicibacillus koreensis]
MPRERTAGNHDSVQSLHADTHKALPDYLQVFTSVAQSARRTIAGQYDQWRLFDMGAWQLQGHTHSTTGQHGRVIYEGLTWHRRPPRQKSTRFG